MIVFLINLVVILTLVWLVPWLLGEWVAHQNASKVNASAFAYTGANTRTELVNQRAHINQDPRFAQNPANTGFIFFYDCRHGDLVLQGELPMCEYFSVSVYDRYAMPLPSVVTDKELKVMAAAPSSAESTKENRPAHCSKPSDFTVFLTKQPTGAINEIDVSLCPQGTGILRYSHMQRPDKIATFEPTLIIQKTL